MSANKTITTITQIQRELERVSKLQTSDPAMDWKAYQAIRGAMFAVLPLLPYEVAVMASRLVGLLDETYAGIGNEEDALFLEPDTSME